MTPALIAILVGAGVFAVVILISQRLGGDRASVEHKQRVLGRIYESTSSDLSSRSNAEDIDILKSDATSAGQILISLPVIGKSGYELAQKAGLENNISGLFIKTGIAFVLFLFILSKLMNLLFALVLAVPITLLFARWRLRGKIAKRNETFINQFPDAVDMIVRSVRSGHPLNTALRMIAENMDPPVRTEFRQVVDEIAYGRTTVEALSRLAQRVDEPDLQFFVVILSVQQETGGNLAEVLSNLSGIIRKRKQLRLRIKAMTSEGRATALILGSLPVLVFGAIHLTSPEYLKVLWETDAGIFVLVTAVSLVALAAFIVNRMLQIDI